MQTLRLFQCTLFNVRLGTSDLIVRLKRCSKGFLNLVSLVTQFLFNGFVTVQVITTKEIKLGTHDDAFFSSKFQFIT